MYTLYYSPGACSLATHTILNLLGQQTNLVNVANVEDFAEVNASKMVPVLVDEDRVLTEGAAIILYLLNKHENNLFPQSGEKRQQAIQNMMMANASVHPAYGRLFFAAANMEDSEAKTAFLNAATNAINDIWKTIEDKIQEGPYLEGSKVSPADILLAVYSRWGQFFPVDITIGSKTQKMIDLVVASEAFQVALKRETEE